MSRLPILLCTLGGIAAAPHAVCGDRDAQLSAQVGRLVRQLDDDRLAQRIAAERELIELGPAILGLLPDAASRLSANQKDRLRTVRSKLELASARETAESSIVTLAGEMSLSDALAAIQRQTGNRIGGNHQRGDVTAAFDKTPFWEALDQLLDQAQLDLIADYQQGGLAVAARPSGQRNRRGAASYSGLFRFEPLRVTALRNLRTPQVNNLQVALRVSWEPRASVIALKLPTGEIRATDDRGASLAVEGRHALLGAEVDGLNTIDLTLPLRLPDREAKQIAELRGQIEATVLGRKQTFEFTRLEETPDAEQSQAGVTLVFEQIRKSQKLYEVRIRVRFKNAADSLASHRDWISRNKAYMIDPSGRPVQPEAEESFLRSDDQIGLAYWFDLKNGPGGCRFVYQTPGAVVRKTFSFQFQDIDLP